MEEFKLTAAQQRIYDLALGTSKNICLLGSPGCGKSVLINAIRSNPDKRFHVAAPTGLAAINVHGRTLHSIFWLPISNGIITKDYNNFPTDQRTLSGIRAVKSLIVDEISMVRIDQFEYINRLLQFANGNREPFGGVQIILVGDFFQLPPVIKRDEARPMKNEFGHEFVFGSPLFETFHIEILSENMRQKEDQGFIKILLECKLGKLSQESLAILNARVNPLINDVRVRLTGKNDEADAINSQFMARLTTEEVVYRADKFGQWKAVPVAEEIRLKVGAQVMVKKNKADVPPHKFGAGGQKSNIVNGTQGVLTGITDNNDAEIRADNGENVTIYRSTWDQKNKVYNSKDKTWSEEITASYDQMPLVPAWAMSMHKSQGQTFSAVHIDPKSVFASGQLYVAISRCRSIEGLTLQCRITNEMFMTNPNVVEFYERLMAKVGVEA